MNHEEKVNQFMTSYNHRGCGCCSVIVELLNEMWIADWEDSIYPSERLANKARCINKFEDASPILHPAYAQPFFSYLYEGCYL